TGAAAKVERARRLGADDVIDSGVDDFVVEVKRLTGKRGADVVVDHVGGDTLARSVLATARGGRIVTCGATAGFHPQIDLRHVFFRQIAILGSTMGSKGLLFGILERVRTGALRPVVDRVLPLWEAREAHRVLESREAFGKIVLEVD
ncbi:MAG: zinc-binding dehydrogenase, partial [Polyangiaceae bacterium]